MKILVLTKRFNMGRDSQKDRHGRMFALPMALRSLGHDVRVLASDYRPANANSTAAPPGPLPWHIAYMFRGRRPAPLHYLSTIHTYMDSWHPDLIWAGSDALQVILGQRLAVKHGLPCVADLKDNYEYFGLTRVPFVKALFRRALKKVAGVTCVSSSLKASTARYINSRSVAVVENGVNRDTFRRTDPTIERQRLGLPGDTFLLGTAGALTSSRGIAALYQAFEQVAPDFPNTALVVAGVRDQDWRPPKHGTYADLGIIDPGLVPSLYNALDLGVICNLDNAFGRYCYPQKYNEMIACGLPIVAARVGLFDSENHLPGLVGSFHPGDADDLAKVLRSVLANYPGRLAKTVAADWNERARVLDQFLTSIMMKHTSKNN
ncbi:glycosyltransferase family 4 protein [Thioalkalivibrio sp. ALMg11]|uniref:glycosyltransferase family 4 protein n=1 Tax=Thioalkalivibrio sp. ALMg11 TaxID=1158165 RepID=UPI0003675A7F|nr:glycosyltransferase family 4 protein [Thioalkalivibrio sp. ALMg11]